MMPTRRERLPARSRAETNRRGSHSINARHIGQLVHGVDRDGLDRRQRQIVSLHIVKLRLDDFIDRVVHEVADHDDRDRHRNREQRERRLYRMAFELPQHHARHVRHQAAEADAFEQRGAVTGRRFRPHRFCRRQANGERDRAERAEHCRSAGDEHGIRDHVRPHLKHELRILVHAQEQFREIVREPHAAESADQPAGDRDQQHKLHVVPRDLQVRVAERFQGGDLLALQTGEPRHHDVQQERRHAQEDRRRNHAGRSQALDVALEQQDSKVGLCVRMRPGSRKVPSRCRCGG